VDALDRDDDGVWIAECPAIPGCVSQGLTRDEALANIREAIGLCLEVRAERGMPLTVPLPGAESISFCFRSSLGFGIWYVGSPSRPIPVKAKVCRYGPLQKLLSRRRDKNKV
jgi:predicted RNase H-like HicB family nuclease